MAIECGRKRSSTNLPSVYLLTRWLKRETWIGIAGDIIQLRAADFCLHSMISASASPTRNIQASYVVTIPAS